MAQNAPSSIDVQDIQFKLHDKFNIFEEGKDLKSLVSLLAVSSAKGLLFGGNPNAKELKVVKLKDLVESKEKGQDLTVRVVPLPAEPCALACSCDGSLLAVNYLQNNTGILQVFQVESFLMPKINSLYAMPISPEGYVFALQLLWNPVIANNVALILSDGSVTVFTLNPGGQYDKFSLGKEYQVKSGCWSPKGKQIVFGFPEGKLQQFKPNLQPARAIPCPPGIHPGPFDCIAVHWLSTFQFAAIYLQKGQNMCPSLFIINAPKAGNLSYINYYDICYSAPEPRMHQITFNHISQWNLLLVSSANGVEVGILGTKESGETPTWTQYTLLDEARIEMPLTESKDESYPNGFVFDTASSHHVKLGEQTLPVMPMVHVLSTHGHLVSFNFLNLSPNAVDVCSPPPPLNDTSGQFRALKDTCKTYGGESERKQSPKEVVTSGASHVSTGLGDMTFTLGANMVTSTPAIKDKTTSMFGSLTTNTDKSTAFGFGSGAPTDGAINYNKPNIGFGIGAVGVAEPNQAAVPPVSYSSAGFGAQQGITPSFSGFGGGLTGYAAAKTSDNQPSISIANTSKSSTANVKAPLYTVPPTYKAPPPIMPTDRPVTAPTQENINTNRELDEVIRQMIAIQIDAFEMEMKQINAHVNKLIENLGQPEELKSYTNRLNDLQEIIEQANDHEFEQDVQSLRHSMNDMYAMVVECRTKLDMYNNPNLTRLTTVQSGDPTSRRQMAKLQSMATINQTQLNQLNLLIDAQWSQYQDVVRRNTKNQMHIPCLDGVYQRMSKLKDLLSRQRSKINHIKSKIKEKGLNYKPPSDIDITTKAVGALNKNQSTMESLADSILSMSLSKIVAQTHAKLSAEKLDALRYFTKQHQQVPIIRPKRPDRIGLKSEVIMETKLQSERKQKELAREKQKQVKEQKATSTLTTFPKESQQSLNQIQQISKLSSLPQNTMGIQNYPQQPHPLLAKPTASKPPLLSNAPQLVAFQTPASSSGLTFGSSSSFVKTSAAITNMPAPFSIFGATQGQTFGQSKTATNLRAESKENVPANMPISFSPKVIGGNDSKSMGNSLTNKPIQSTGEAVINSNQGLASFSSSKPANVDFSNKDNTNPEQATKTVTFGSISSNLSPPAANASSFTGFGSLSKPSAPTTFSFVTPSTGAGMFSSAMLGSTTTSTPFNALSSNSAVPFGNSSSFSFTGSSNSSPGTTSTTSSAFTSSTATIKNTDANEEDLKGEKAVPIAKPFQAPTSSSASFGGVDIGTTATASAKSSAPPNVVIGAKNVTDTEEPSSTTASKPDATDAFLDSLNICKPDSGDAAKPAGNIFSGLGAKTPSSSAPAPFVFATGSGAGEGSISFFGSTTSNAASTGFSFGMGTPGTSNLFAKPETVATKKPDATLPIPASLAETSVATTTTTTSSNTIAPTSTSIAAETNPISSSASTFSFGNALASSGFESMSLSATSSGSAIATGPSFFGSSVGSTPATASTTSIFSGTTPAASAGLSLLGSTVPSSSTAATPAVGSIFAGNAVTSPTQSGGSIFAGIPKPDQSVFSAAASTTAPASTGIFAAAAAATKSPVVVGGGSMFGGGSITSGFGAPAGATTGSSIFGGSSASSPFGASVATNNAPSMFGGAAAAKPAESGSIFNSSPQQSVASVGSIFGKTTFGQPAGASPQSGGSLFGGAAAQSSAGGGFGSPGGSIFSGSSTSSNQTSGGSIFAATAAATAPAFGATGASTGFGSFSQPSNAPAFGSPSGGFGSPGGGAFNPSTQQSAFAKPIFGGPATFGSPPAFGAQPTFGGGATFGSPKGFGAFGATSPTTGGFGAPDAGPAGADAPKGNIFDTLGSTDSGLSFGNLAHNTQQQAQQKPSFGGSSFMSYRS